MATGILGQAAPTANTNTVLYTVPASVSGTFNINVVNTGTTAATVTISIAATSTPSASEYIEYNTPLAINQVLERTGLVAQTGKNVVVNCSVGGCAVSVYGYEA
jgi:hypothetical protein